MGVRVIETGLTDESEIPPEDARGIKNPEDMEDYAKTIVEKAEKELEDLPPGTETGEVKDKRKDLQRVIDVLNVFMGFYRENQSNMDFKVVTGVLDKLKKSDKNRELVRKLEALVRIAELMPKINKVSPKIKELKESASNEIVLVNKDTILVWLPKFNKLRFVKVKPGKEGQFESEVGEDFSYARLVEYADPSVFGTHDQTKYLSRLPGEEFTKYSSIIINLTNKETTKQARESAARNLGDGGRLVEAFNRIGDQALVERSLRAGMVNRVATQIQNGLDRQFIELRNSPENFNMELGPVGGKEPGDIQYLASLKDGKVVLEVAPKVTPRYIEEDKKPGDVVAQRGERGETRKN